MRYASLDIGTVTCRLLIADVDGGRFCEVYKGYGITNLGAGVAETGCLSNKSMQATFDQISKFLEIINEYNRRAPFKIEVLAVATSAARDAKNSAEFLDRLKEIGVTPRIISGYEEASLSFLGAAFELSGENLIVVDIGGGSTEVIVGKNGESPLFIKSFDIGCRRVTDKFFASDPPTVEELARAKNFVRTEMNPYFQQIAKSGFELDRLVAVAGTPTSVVSIHEEMKVYDSSKVHHYEVDSTTLDEVFAHLLKLSLPKRKEVIGLDPGRAGVIVAGLLILSQVLELSGARSFTASESDILQGIIINHTQINASP
jgi:exopolyphosphatase/guanosine-5'-triphosphate,3'-diphosphate pyrophosphatase